MTEVVGAGAVDGVALTNDAGTCAPCHADVVTQWRTSAHAFSSFSNPIYRVSVQGFRKATSPETSRFCAGCHDVALLIDGAMEKSEVAGDDPRAHAGVTCLTCHSIDEARKDGNGSYTLRTDPVVMPKEGDPESLAAHKKRLALGPLRRVEMCASCHRAFLGVATGHGHHLPGADDYGAWLTSAYAGNDLDRVDGAVEKSECRGCHMPAEAAPEGDVAAKAGKVRSHRFVGGHSWLAAMRGDQEQVARVRAMLKGAASIDLAAVRDMSGRVFSPPESAPVRAGTTVDLEVVVTNERVGHKFPGGTLDMHDVWIEVVVEDARGARIGAHGTAHTADAMSGDAHVLHAAVVDDQGRPVLARRVEAFRAVAYDNTIRPRDSVVVPYALTLPAETELPLTARVRLLHRSREPELARAACKDAERPTYERITALDPCVAQPITVIATSAATLGGASETGGALTLALAERLLRHGVGWQHVLVEEIDKARPSLVRIMSELAPDEGRARDLVAAAAHQLASVAARQGRIDEMNDWLARAQSLAPGHPALAFVRGTALSSVWRHPEAIPWLRVAASGAPTDPRGWKQLAIGLGSVGDDRAALAAAQLGLAFASRDPDLLRVQSLALPEGGASAMGRPARAAFLSHRRRDDAPTLRTRCSDRVVGCAVERTPAHRHPLR